MPKNTDAEWEEWGRRDPYFGVITDPQFRSSIMNADSKRAFFESGRAHVAGVLATIRMHIEPNFSPRNVLDFGCGVGRLLIPFSAVANNVVGLDVSSSMLEEANRNCQERGLDNVRLLRSDDQLSLLTDKFDLVHSCIVLQHIPVDRGRTIFANLLDHLHPGGVAAIQFTYSKACFAATHGVAAPASVEESPVAPDSGSHVDPEIQMNPYNVNEIFFLMQLRGITQMQCLLTDHGGELGMFLFFQIPVLVQ